MEADGGVCCWRSPGYATKELRRPKQAGGTIREERRVERSWAWPEGLINHKRHK